MDSSSVLSLGLEAPLGEEEEEDEEEEEEEDREGEGMPGTSSTSCTVDGAEAPAVAADVDDVIVVGDSKEGWSVGEGKCST